MAKGKKTGGRDFKKGVVTNPNGRVKLAPEVKAMRNLNKNTLTTLLNKHINSSLQELDVIAKDKNTSALELIVISAIKFSITKGDSKSREFLIERMVGKVPQDMNINADIVTHKTIIEELEND